MLTYKTSEPSVISLSSNTILLFINLALTIAFFLYVQTNFILLSDSTTLTNLFELSVETYLKECLDKDNLARPIYY